MHLPLDHSARPVFGWFDRLRNLLRPRPSTVVADEAWTACAEQNICGANTPDYTFAKGSGRAPPSGI